MPQKFLSIKNFEKYQHFKKANPPWIKLYRSMFTDLEFMRLSISCKYLYIGLVILASEGSNRVPNDLHFISHRLSINSSEINLKPLYKAGFLIASESTIYRETISQRRDREETETEERERESIVPAAPVLLPRKRVLKPETEWPEGFQSNDKHKAIADGLGLNVHTEFVKFKDKAQSKGWTYKDWEAAFRTWLNNAAEFKQARMR